MKKLLFVLLISFFAANAFAQSGEKISPQRKQAIDSLALEKVRDLSKYISIIGNKATPWSEADKAITRTLELFMEGSQMGVSKLGSSKVKYFPIKKYLEQLMLLNYQKVNIEWYNIQYVSDLEPMPDGRYVGIITVYQRFEGETKEGLKYIDETKKDITVYVEKKKTQIQGIDVTFWDVLLGDIRVKQTKKG